MQRLCHRWHDRSLHMSHLNPPVPWVSFIFDALQTRRIFGSFGCSGGLEYGLLLLGLTGTGTDDFFHMLAVLLGGRLPLLRQRPLLILSFVGPGRMVDRLHPTDRTFLKPRRGKRCSIFEVPPSLFAGRHLHGFCVEIGIFVKKRIRDRVVLHVLCRSNKKFQLLLGTT